MTRADILHLMGLLERGVTALERISAALEQMNAADPLQMISEAMAMEQRQEGDGPPITVKPDDWRFT